MLGKAIQDLTIVIGGLVKNGKYPKEIFKQGKDVPLFVNDKKIIFSREGILYHHDIINDNTVKETK
jgi:hypothetical protein